MGPPYIVICHIIFLGHYRAKQLNLANVVANRFYLTVVAYSLSNDPILRLIKYFTIL